MDVNTVKKWVEYLANTNGRGYDTPDQFNTSLLMAETMFVAERLGLPEDYTPGLPVGNEGYPLTAKIDDDLRPYLKTSTFTVPSDGLYPLPGDYLRRSDLTLIYSRVVSSRKISLECDESEIIEEAFKTRGVNVDVLFNNEYTDRKWHSYLEPTLEYPICTFNDAGIEFAPENIGVVRFDYISVPIGAYWGWTDVGGHAVYSAATSRQLQCPQDCYSKIAGFMLNGLGLNMSNETVIAAGQRIWANGG